jgi:Flp pilus assembly protein TadG
MEVALIAPWIFFVFVATLDFGFYSYWMQAVANASRAAALSASSNGLNQTAACKQVLNEMRGVMGWDAANTAGSCAAAPLTVTLTELDSTTTPTSADGNSSVLVTVIWQTSPLIPVPGIVNQFTLQRDTEMRLQ